jgi:hypothetical protein
VLAALGSGPSSIPVVNWLGWAAAGQDLSCVCRRLPIIQSLGGSHSLQGRGGVPGYARARGQEHQSHQNMDQALARDDFNLPEDSFIFFFPATTNRLTKAVFFLWLTVVTRLGVDGSCLLLLNKPRRMRRITMKWIQEHTATIDPNFDPIRVIFRPV